MGQRAPERAVNVQTLVCRAADWRANRGYASSLVDCRFGRRRCRDDYFPADWM